MIAPILLVQEVVTMPRDYDDYGDLDDLSDMDEDDPDVIANGLGDGPEDDINEDDLSALDEDDRDASYYEYMWGGPEDGELEGDELPDDLSDMGKGDWDANYYENPPLPPTPPTPWPDDKVTAAKTQLQQLQWFYDDAGYYSYVLLNAPEELFKEIQQLFRSKGLRIPLAGRSYRPASNGVQYQWYIRVSDESGKHPARKRIEEIFAGYKAREVKGVTLIPEPKNRIAELEREVERQKGISQRLAQRLGWARIAYERSQRELQNYQQRLNDLEQLLSQIQKAALTPEDVDKIRQHYEQTIQQLKQELQNRRQELEDYHRTFDSENQELRNRLAIVEEEKRQLEAQIHELRRAQPQELEKGNAEYLFRELLGFFLPQIEFLDGSLDTLWREMRDPLDVLRDLTRLGELKARRVRKAEDWLERHIDSKWRLYFRKCEDSKWQVLISHKNTQDTDINWLSRQ